MLHIDIKQAKPGMTIAMPILHPHRPDSVLLKAGYRIDDTTIRRLAELNQSSVWVSAPGFESVDEYLCSAVELERRKLLQVATQAMSDIHDHRVRRHLWREFGETISALTESLLGSPSAALFIENDDLVEYRTLDHAANTAYLATLIGMKLQGYLVRQRRRLNARHATNLTTLALGAMLHDVGLAKLDEQVLAKWHELHDETDSAWQRHVQFGYEVVTGKVQPAAAAIVLHHHQYYDGSGFPQKASWDGGRTSGLKGEAIHVFARIVAAADHFDELRTMYSSRPRPLVEVLSKMVSGRLRRRFDPVVMRAVLEIVPAYTPGRRVLLSTGEEAFVMDWRTADPCHPRVAVIDDLSPLCLGQQPPHRVIDLAATPEVRITHSQGVDVSQFEFSIPEEFVPKAGHGLHLLALDAA